MADDPHSTAHNPAAPADERFDAGADLAKNYRPSTIDLIPSDKMQSIIDFINTGLDDAAMLKASNILKFPDARGGYGRGTQGHRDNKRGMQSLFVDDLQVFASGEYFEKPSPVGFDALRVMCEQVPVLASVVQTRIRQVNRFCGISEDGGPGFEIRHVERKHILTSEEQTTTDLLAKFMQNCGWEFNSRARKRLRRNTFAQFMAKSIRDSLAMDACPIECEWKVDHDLGLDGFYAVDGSTIRLCMEDGYKGDDEIFALQVVNGRIVTAYNLDQLIYEVRNPRTDVRLSGYGMAEPEMLIRVVTGFLNAMTYNIKGFDDNSIPKGLLHMSGDYSQEDITAFRRYWNSMVKGINNAWALPVMISKDSESKASFEKFGVEFNEMYFAKWMAFLVSIVCAIYGMDPGEINFESFAANKSTLSGSDTTEKLSAAKDKGLLPFLSFYESMLTEDIIQVFSEKYCFRWVGLEEEDPEQAWAAQQLILTVNELRAEKGYEPYPAESDGPDLGAAPLNPALMPAWIQATMPQTQEFGGEKPESSEDFGVVPGDGGGKPAPGMPSDSKPPKMDTGGSFGGKKPSMAKAYIIGGDGDGQY